MCLETTPRAGLSKYYIVFHWLLEGLGERGGVGVVGGYGGERLPSNLMMPLLGRARRPLKNNIDPGRAGRAVRLVTTGRPYSRDVLLLLFFTIFPSVYASLCCVSSLHSGV